MTPSAETRAKISATLMMSRTFADADVIAYVNEGHSIGETSDEFGRSERTIRNILTLHGASPFKKEVFWNDERQQKLASLWGIEPKLRITVIAAELGVTTNAIIGRARRSGLPQRDTATSRSEPPEVRLEAQTRLRAGDTVTEVSKALGIGFWTTCGMRRRLGLPKADRPAPVIHMLPVAKPLPVSLVPLMAQRSLPLGKGRRCEWLEGDDKPYVQCNHDAHNGSWCAGHRKRVFLQASA